MKRFREVIQSPVTPEDESVLWLDTSTPEEPVLRYYCASGWVSIAGGGPSPTPTTLLNTYYYGALNERVTAQTINISELSGTKNRSTTGNFNETYYYIAISLDQSIVSVITENQENITSQFNNIGTLSVDGKIYRLFEFFLDTFLPFNITATITISGN